MEKGQLRPLLIRRLRRRISDLFASEGYVKHDGVGDARG